jgi:hypothetical protein
MVVRFNLAGFPSLNQINSKVHNKSYCNKELIPNKKIDRRLTQLK